MTSDNSTTQEIRDAKAELTPYKDFVNTYSIDIARNQGFIHHPSRETNCLVDGAYYREHQAKLFESMRVQVAQALIRRRVFEDEAQAFRARDHARHSRVAKYEY